MTTAKKKPAGSQVHTVKTDKETAERLAMFCKKNDITQKSFISLALDYFERTGININSSDAPQDLTDIREKIDNIFKLQADAAVKLTGIQQSTNLINEKQENTAKLLEANTQKKRSWFGFAKK